MEAWLKGASAKPQIVHVTGMRQTGKTTLLRRFLAGVRPTVSFDLQDLVTLRRYEDAPEDWAMEIETSAKSAPGGLNVFVDEIQKIPALFQALQGLYDRYKGLTKFWICGSSAVALKRRKAETLAGRVLARILYPFSQTELLDRPSIVPRLFSTSWKRQVPPEPRGYRQMLRGWLTRSLLPEACLLSKDSDAFELLENYAAIYVENEIRRENLVLDIGTFGKFLTLAGGYNGRIVNYSALSSALGVSGNTVKSYYALLEDTFVCRALPAFSGSYRVQVSKSPKIYLTDAGLARILAGHRHAIRPDTPEFGAALECFVVNELTKQIEYACLPWKLFYFRTGTGVEVDLVIEWAGKAVAVEIKSTARPSAKDASGIRRLMALDSRVKKGFVFNLSPGVREISRGIYSIPIWSI